MVDSWELAFWLEPDLPYAFALLDRLPEMGIRYVGVAPTELWRTDEHIEEFGLHLASSGLQMLDCHSAVGLIFEQPGKEEEALADCRRQVDIAAHWSAKTLTFHHDSFRDKRDAYWLTPKSIGSIWQRQGREECDRRFEELLMKLAPYGASHGITVCLENIVLSPRNDEVADIIKMLERLGLDNLGCCLDSSHLNGSGKKVGDNIRKAHKWLKMTHFSDSLGPMGWKGDRLAEESDLNCRDLHLVVGLGTINWFDVCAALREADFPGPVFFEGPKIPGQGPRTLETETRSIELTMQNWRAFESGKL